MPRTARYCDQCAAPVEVRELDGRPREVCSSCGMIFYRNPLPVAAAVVLNERRQVLLVLRGKEPHKGMWCLPTGFAETQETIEQAALRELEEETGILGRAVRLVDVESHASPFYGDLLIVTFEAEPLGGELRAGDDADDVAWFPLDSVPKLAFEANEKAIAVCSKGHLEGWAIQDSFRRLQTGLPEELLSDELVRLIGEQAEAVAGLWLAEVQSNPSTLAYHGRPPETLLERASGALSQFGRWLRGDEDQEEVRAFYRSLGWERRAQGFPLHDVVSSLTLLRKHVWTFARGQGMFDRPLDAYRVLELDRRIVAFFDRAVFHTVRGYEEAELHK